eukprot:09725_6
MKPQHTTPSPDTPEAKQRSQAKREWYVAKITKNKEKNRKWVVVAVMRLLYCFWIGRKSLNSGGSSSSERRSEKMRRMRQFAWIWTRNVSIFVPARRVKSLKLNWIFHPSSKRMGIVQMKGFTRVVDWLEARKRLRTFLSSSTWISKVKYFFKFFMIMTRKGSLIPRVFCGSAGHVIKFVLTFDPAISRTLDWMSGSVIRLMWPLRTCLSHIWSGLLPILYKMERNPDWKVFLNMLLLAEIGRKRKPLDSWSFLEEVFYKILLTA